MPRINVEDTLWCDDRFLTLIEKVGSRATAVGAVVLAFRCAQGFWIPDKKDVPKPVFMRLPNAEDLIFCNLARVSPCLDFVHVSGSEKQFKWIIQRIEAAKSGNAIRWGNSDRDTIATLPVDLAELSPLPLPPSLSLKEEEAKTKKKKGRKEEGNLPTESLESGKNRQWDGVYQPAVDEWLDTLKHFKISRPLMPMEDIRIARKVQAVGLCHVIAAFRGMRLESKVDDFDPSEHVSLDRVLDIRKFQKFVNLGSSKKEPKLTLVDRLKKFEERENELK